MPMYTDDLVVPAGKPEAEAIEETIEIEKGVITKVEVHFPPGPCGLVHTRCFYGIRQLWPRPEGSTAHLNGVVLVIPEHWQLPETPCVLTVKGWSPGTGFPHTITWNFYTLPRALAAPWLVMQDFIAILKRLMGIP